MVLKKFSTFVTNVSGRCPLKRAWSWEIYHCCVLPIDSRFYTGLAECDKYLPKPFRKSPVINTKFGNDIHVKVPTITDNNKMESTQSRLQWGTTDCDRIAFRLYMIILIVATVFYRVSSVSIGSLSGLCFISVASHLIELRRCRDRFGRFVPCKRFKLD